MNILLYPIMAARLYHEKISIYGGIFHVHRRHSLGGGIANLLGGIAGGRYPPNSH